MQKSIEQIIQDAEVLHITTWDDLLEKELSVSVPFLIIFEGGERRLSTPLFFDDNNMPCPISFVGPDAKFIRHFASPAALAKYAESPQVMKAIESDLQSEVSYLNFATESGCFGKTSVDDLLTNAKLGGMGPAPLSEMMAGLTAEIACSSLKYHLLADEKFPMSEWMKKIESVGGVTANELGIRTRAFYRIARDLLINKFSHRDRVRFVKDNPLTTFTLIIDLERTDYGRGKVNVLCKNADPHVNALAIPFASYVEYELKRG